MADTSAMGVEEIMVPARKCVCEHKDDRYADDICSDAFKPFAPRGDDYCGNKAPSGLRCGHHPNCHTPNPHRA